jgi:hypothetical protein
VRLPDARGRRRWAIALAIAVVLVALGAWAARHYTRPETLTALLIERTRSQLGAELSLSGSGRFGFFPDLHLVLPHPTLRESSQPAPILSAETVDIVVPWSMLWSGRYDIRNVEVIAPKLDLAALDHWIVARPPAGKLPDVRFALRVRNATLISGGRTIASGVDLAFTSAGDLAAWLEAQPWQTSSAALLPPLNGTAGAATVDIGGTRIEGVRIEARADDGNEPASGGPQP